MIAAAVSSVSSGTWDLSQYQNKKYTKFRGKWWDVTQGAVVSARGIIRGDGTLDNLPSNVSLLGSGTAVLRLRCFPVCADNNFSETILGDNIGTIPGEAWDLRKYKYKNGIDGELKVYEEMKSNVGALLASATYQYSSYNRNYTFNPGGSLYYNSAGTLAGIPDYFTSDFLAVLLLTCNNCYWIEDDGSLEVLFMGTLREFRESCSGYGVARPGFHYNAKILRQRYCDDREYIILISRYTVTGNTVGQLVRIPDGIPLLSLFTPSPDAPFSEDSFVILSSGVTEDIIKHCGTIIEKKPAIETATIEIEIPLNIELVEELIGEEYNYYNYFHGFKNSYGFSIKASLEDVVLQCPDRVIGTEIRFWKVTAFPYIVESASAYYTGLSNGKLVAGDFEGISAIRCIEDDNEIASLLDSDDTLQYYNGFTNRYSEYSPHKTFAIANTKRSGSSTGTISGTYKWIAPFVIHTLYRDGETIPTPVPPSTVKLNIEYIKYASV
jgi:hypothetical protein